MKNTVYTRNMITAALACMMILTGCGSASAAKKETTVPSASPETTENAEGGWAVNNADLSLEKNPEARTAFEKATENLTGYIYEPIALLGTQVAAGTNYSILVRGTAVTPEARPVYSIITVYEDLNGNAEITDTKDLTENAEEGAAGAFEVNDGEYDFNQNKDVQDVFDKALADLVGESYEPVAYIGSQVVAGTTYYAVYRSTPVVPDAASEFVLVTATESPDGTVEPGDITSIFPEDGNEVMTDDKNAQIATPFHTVAALEDAEKETGIEIHMPESINGSASVKYQVYDEGMLEVLYEDADGNILAEIRKIKGQQDNLSGDYTDYSTVKYVEQDDTSITIKGNDNLYYAAEWSADGCTLSLRVDNGMGKTAFLETVSSIH